MPSDNARYDDYGLRELDFLSDPEERRAALEEVRRAAADIRPDAPLEGADASNSVWVTVDLSSRILDVSISRSWQERLGNTSRLGSALLEAYTDATTKAITAATTLDLVGNDSVRRDRGPDESDYRDDDNRQGQSIEERLYQLATKLNELARVDVEQTPETTVPGPYGYVRLTLRGQEIVDIEVQAGTDSSAAADRIAADALAAFQGIQNAVGR